MKIKRQTEIEVNINDIQVGDATTVKLKDGEVVDFLAASLRDLTGWMISGIFISAKGL